MTARKTTLIGIAIVGFWLITMTALFQREVLPRLMPSTKISAALTPSDEWFGVYLNDDARVGVLHLVSQPAERDGEKGTELAVDARLNLALLEFNSEIIGAASVWLPHDRERIIFNAQMASGEHTMEIDGAIDAGILTATVKTANESFPVQWPVGDVGLSASIFSTSPIPPMHPGESTLIPAFDPMSMEMRNATVRCLRRETWTEGETSEPVTVYETSLNSITSQMWLDADGETVQIKTPYGFTLRRMAPEEATAPLAAGAADLLALVAIHPAGATPVRGAERMVARVSAYDKAATLPSDATQHVTDDGLLVIEVPEPPASVSVTALESADLAEALASDPLIQATHPDIVAQARSIVGDTEGVWPQSLRIYQWVYDNIAKKPVPSVPSALDVLKTREGDCNEHTILFTALARAVEIPTRVAVGVVWSDELGAFYYHAWPEIYAGAWIPMDPTLGQTIADATHLKLVEGDIHRWPRLAAYLGRMQIEVLEVE